MATSSGICPTRGPSIVLPVGDQRSLLHRILNSVEVSLLERFDEDSSVSDSEPSDDELDDPDEDDPDEVDPEEELDEESLVLFALDLFFGSSRRSARRIG